MKFSLRLLQHYQDRYNLITGNFAPDGVDALVEKIGAQLGAVEEVVNLGSKYAGAVIVRVVSCQQHPNADRLRLCAIDDGGAVQDVPRDENGLVQVVCGAPNVREGLTVVWLPPGATVPSTYESEPFVLSSRELRGIVSHGMLASPKELAVSDSHEGLLEVVEDIPAGTSFADYCGFQDDVIIDIENKMFTHRPDLFGWLGIARELAGIQGQSFRSPDWYSADAQLPVPSSDDLRVEVSNELPDLVPRFIAVPIAGVTVGPSPLWLQASLSRVGLRPINNIVDLTNYYMLLTGQPLHAYDYDKVLAQDPSADHATITVRYPRAGEKLMLLNGKEIEPRAEAIMIASATTAIGLAGVMGGADTEVDEHTTNIILECATFDMYSIRRTSMAHGLFSDAVTRFNKGQSPLQNAAVASRITQDILSVAGGSVAGTVVDDNQLPGEVRQLHSLHGDVTLTAEFVNQRLGLQLAAEDMRRLLENVEFVVNLHNDNGQEEITVRAPFWRTDIEIAEDVVEEIGRLYGFDKLPLDLPKRPLVPAQKHAAFEAKSAIRSILSEAGATEILTYSFVHSNLLQKTGQDPQHAYRLSNALSPDLQYYRLSLTPSLLEKVQPNIKAGYGSFALYEMGKAHVKGLLDDEGLPLELGRLGFVFAANAKTAAAYAGAPYYQARLYLDRLLSRFSLPQDAAVSYVALHAYDFGEYEAMRQMSKPYEPLRSAAVLIGDHFVGIVGEYQHAVSSKLKLPEYAAGFEIFLSVLQKPADPDYRPIPRYPRVEQDICLRVPAGTSYRQVYGSLQRQLVLGEPEAVISSLAPVDIYQREDSPEHKQITLRYTIASYDKTMTDTEVAHLLQRAAEAVCEELQAEIV